MGGASVCMRLVDERSMVARGFVSSLLWVTYVIVLGVMYLFWEKETYVFMLLRYDGLVGFIVLLAILGGCLTLQKLYRHR